MLPLALQKLRNRYGYQRCGYAVPADVKHIQSHTGIIQILYIKNISSDLPAWFKPPGNFNVRNVGGGAGQQALLDAALYYLQLDGFVPEQVLESRLTER